MTEQSESVATSAASVNFFMHIAKTAGSYMNDVFRRSLGERFVEHCEAQGRLNGDPKVRMWSGHIYLEQWRRAEIKFGQKVNRFTLVREPLAQLASHILWLDHYSENRYLGEFRALDIETRQVVEEISATDLSDAGDLDRLLVNLSGRGIMYLDNCQARYFIAGGNTILRNQPIHLGMRSILQESAKEFAVIGVSEKINDYIDEVSSVIGIKLMHGDTRVNEAKSSRTIDLSNSDIRTVLSKRTTLDTWLYQSVRSNW